jgi:prepilin-type N-terminal cleavage/methylation domain-containing protein
MKMELKSIYRKAGQPHRAFTLIEVIAVLAVLAILAAILVPALLRQMDRLAGEQESATLVSFDEALQQSILRNRYIPTYSNMAPAIATELGVEIASVTRNPRGQPRFFLIDPAWRIGTNLAGLPYSQTAAGSTNLPVTARALILSSIGRALPAGIVSGVPSPDNFTNIWNAADGTMPAAPEFSGWTGSPQDIRIQRINLAPRFARLILNSYASSGTPSYSIDSSTAIPVGTNSGIDTYFIQNSVLSLHTHLNVLDSRQILIRDNSFVYNQNVWQGSIVEGFLLAGLDIAGVVDRYLSASPNPRARFGTNQQSVVVSNMQAYIDAYITWAVGGFVHTGASKAPSYVTDAQAAMLQSVQDQYLGTYAPIPVPCP